MFELNGTYIVFIASFLIFMVLLNEIMLKPVGKAIAERRAQIAADIEAGKLSREKAESEVAQYKDKLSATRSEAQRVIGETMLKAQKVRDEKLQGVQNEGRKRVEVAKAELASEKDSLLEGLVEQEMEIVSTITKKLLGNSAVATVDRNKVKKALEEAC